MEPIEALLAEGKWAEAEAALLEFVGRHPEHPRAHALLGQAFGKRGDVENAAKYTQRAWALDPTDWASGKNLMKCYEYLQNPREALAVANDLKRLRPNDPDVVGVIERCSAILNPKQPEQPQVSYD